MIARRLSFAAALVAAACVQVQAREEADAGARLLSQASALAQFSGAFEVTRSGVRIAAGAAGSADGAAPFTLETASDSASLAKPMTAELVLALVMEGRLTLDDRVSEHLPEYPYTDTTIRDLLDHSSALPDYAVFQSLLDTGEPVSTLDLLGALRASEVSGTPSQNAFSYCNLCYDVLGEVSGVVAGEPLSAVFEARLFGPAGMDMAFLRPARFADWPGRAPWDFVRGGMVGSPGVHLTMKASMAAATST